MMHFAWQLLGLCLCLAIDRGWTRARPSNPFEQIAMGALNVGEQIMSTMQDGNKATKQLNFDSPLMKIHSKTEVGHGNAMRPPSDDDSDESDERRRRRRRRRSNWSGSNYNQSEHLVQHRGKRSPCFNKMMTPEPSDDIEARKKAAAKKRAANNAVRSRIIRTMDKKNKKKLHRKRRQAMLPEGAAGQSTGQGPSIGDRVKGLWLSFVDNVVDVVQQMRQQIRGASAQATGNGN